MRSIFTHLRYRILIQAFQLQNKEKRDEYRSRVKSAKGEVVDEETVVPQKRRADEVLPSFTQHHSSQGNDNRNDDQSQEKEGDADESMQQEESFVEDESMAESMVQDESMQQQESL